MQGKALERSKVSSANARAIVVQCPDAAVFDNENEAFYKVG
jgi:hypothetical protein